MASIDFGSASIISPRVSQSMNEVNDQSFQDTGWSTHSNNNINSTMNEQLHQDQHNYLASMNLNSAELQAQRTSTVSPSASSRPSSPDPPMKRRKLHDEEEKRRERNAREKARSNKISSQFDDLKEILISSGVAVPRSTKGSILETAMHYIKTLQVQAHQTELERQRLKQTIDRGLSANDAVQQGMSSLLETPTSNAGVSKGGPSWNSSYYKDAFQHCAVGMAIANVEGTMVQGNQVFCKLMNREPHQVPSLTIFNLVAKDQLTLAFEKLGAWLEGTDTASSFGLKACIPGMALHISKIANADPTRLEVDCQRNRLLITIVQAGTMAATAAAAETAGVSSITNPTTMPSHVPSSVKTFPEATTSDMSAVTTNGMNTSPSSSKNSSTNDLCQPMETPSASDAGLSNTVVPKP